MASLTKILDDVPEGEIRKAIDFMGAVVRLAPARTASRIAQMIADECLLSGESMISHKELERRTGACRRTVQRALRTLIDRDAIFRVRRTEGGHSVYRCRWERGAEFRAEREVRINGNR